MPIVRQLPRVYLRGSVATITMANLTEDEKRELNELLPAVANHREMVKHKQEIIKQFGVTIGGDYSDDRTTAEHEYQIAIWRGLVSLLYHKDYLFKCGACQQSSYKTKRGKSKAIDQLHLSCPNCNKVKIDSLGSIQHDSQFIDYDEYRALLANGHVGCDISSPIEPIAGSKKYENPKDILNDPKQLKKFFGEFAWNYFRQHLKENSRVVHRKTPQTIKGKPSYIILKELINACQQMKIDCVHDESISQIHFSTLQTPPEFSVEFSRIQEKANKHGIMFDIDNNSISLKVTDVSSNQGEIEAVVVMPEHVTVLDNQQTVSDDDGGSTLEQVDYRFIEGRKMILEDHVSAIETSDALTTIRKALPDGTCRAIYDIFCQNGQAYDEFSDRFGSGDPKLNQIAEYFGLTVRAINEFKEQIKLVCLSHGLSL